jgi:hypothetical protein
LAHHHRQRDHLLNGFDDFGDEAEIPLRKRQQFQCYWPNFTSHDGGARAAIKSVH